MDSIQPGLAELQVYRQWINYFFLSRGEKITKPPLNPHIDARRSRTERLASVTDNSTWGTYAEALARWKASVQYGYRGIGFVFTADDPFCGVDLDNCVRSQGKQRMLTPEAQRIIRVLNSYTELSPTEKGIHIILKASLPTVLITLHRSDLQHKNSSRRVEIYDRLQYFTITGKQLPGTASRIEERQDELTMLYAELFPLIKQAPAHQQPAPADLPNDRELIERAKRASRSGAKFERLWNGDAGDYANDESRADQALLGLLAFWTQRDALRMERLFKLSGRFQGRPDRQRKWNATATSDGTTYGERSIQRAIQNCAHVYDPRWQINRKRTFPNDYKNDGAEMPGERR